MREWLMARAARLSAAAGAELVVMATLTGQPPAPLNALWLGGCPVPFLDQTDRELALVGDDLQTRALDSGIQLLALQREGNRLHILLDDSTAEEPLSPGALQSAVRQITWHRLGQVWDAVLHATVGGAPMPATPVQAPLPAPAA